MVKSEKNKVALRFIISRLDSSDPIIFAETIMKITNYWLNQGEAEIHREMMNICNRYNLDDSEIETLRSLSYDDFCKRFSDTNIKEEEIEDIALISYYDSRIYFILESLVHKENILLN